MRFVVGVFCVDVMFNLLVLYFGSYGGYLRGYAEWVLKQNVFKNVWLRK
jgi:hypothetical protein